MRSILQKSSELTKAYVFFIISLILIWLIDLPYILALQRGETPGILLTILLLIGNYSPLLTAILLVALEKGGAGVKELFRQLKPKKSLPSNFLLAFFYQPVLLVAAWLLYGAITGDFALKEAIYPVYMLPLVFVVIFFQAGLAEEVDRLWFTPPEAALFFFEGKYHTGYLLGDMACARHVDSRHLSLWQACAFYPMVLPGSDWLFYF